MRTVSFRISEKNHERLMEIKEKWNNEDRRVPDIDPYTMTDVINSCICIIWETEFTLGLSTERREDVKEILNE